MFFNDLVAHTMKILQIVLLFPLSKILHVHRVYTEYAVVVSAFNKIGQGPTTGEIRSYTAEGTPQQPPHDVTCTTLTSQTIRVSWASPPLETVQGVIKGYKVIYGPSDKWYGKFDGSVC